MILKMSTVSKNIAIGTLAVVAIASGSLTIRETQVKHTTTQEQKLFSYTNKASLGYEVNLNSTELYDEMTLGEDLYYMSDYIDNIAVEFKDLYEGSGDVDIKGNYNITSELRGYTIEYEGENEVKHTVWNKKTILRENRSFNETTSKFQIDETLKIDIQPYRQFVKKLVEEKQYAIPTEVIIQMTGKKMIDTPKGDIEIPINSNIAIPIDPTYFTITKFVTDPVEEIQTEMVELPISFNKSYVIGGCIVSVLAMIGCIVIGILGRDYTNEEKYYRKLKRIFIEHGSRMVGINRLDQQKFENNYFLAHIEDLVKLADELEKPIMYVKVADESKINSFYVSDQDNLYTFILEMSSQQEESILTKEEKQALKLKQKEEKKLKKLEAKALKQKRKQGDQFTQKDKKAEKQSHNYKTEIVDERTEAVDMDFTRENQLVDHEKQENADTLNHFKTYYEDKQ